MSKYKDILSLEEASSKKVEVWISTGLLPVDFIIHSSGGGIPAGRIISVEGDFSSGKSTLLAHIFKSCIESGIEAFLCDSENSFTNDFAKRVGVDTSKLWMLKTKEGLPIQIIEDLGKAVHGMCDKIFKKDPDLPVVLGIDSVEALQAESYVKTGKKQIGDRARVLNSFWRDICSLQGKYKNLTMIVINQLRDNIKTSMFDSSPNKVSSGGRALNYYSHVVLQLTKRKSLSEASDNYEPYATIVDVKVTKSKISKPFKRCSLYNSFSRGFNNEISVLYLLADKKILKKQPGKTTSYSCDYFKLEETHIGNEILKIDEIKLSQAGKFLERCTWKNLLKLLIVQDK